MQELWDGCTCSVEVVPHFAENHNEWIMMDMDGQKHIVTSSNIKQTLT